jgi:hypothetical protein
MRMAHMLLLEQRQLAGVDTHMAECLNRVHAANEAFSGSLIHVLLLAQLYYDFPTLNDQALDDGLAAVRAVAAVVAATPAAPNAADLEYAKAIATFDEEVFTLALFPDVRECADSAPCRTQALANLAKAPTLITDLHREVGDLAICRPDQSKLDLFITLRDANHVAEAARRCRRVQGADRTPECDPADVAAAAAARVTGNDLFREQKYTEVRLGISTPLVVAYGFPH